MRKKGAHPELKTNRQDFEFYRFQSRLSASVTHTLGLLEVTN